MEESKVNSEEVGVMPKVRVDGFYPRLVKLVGFLMLKTGLESSHPELAKIIEDSKTFLGLEVTLETFITSTQDPTSTTSQVQNQSGRTLAPSWGRARGPGPGKCVKHG